MGDDPKDGRAKAVCRSNAQQAGTKAMKLGNRCIVVAYRDVCQFFAVFCAQRSCVCKRVGVVER